MTTALVPPPVLPFGDVLNQQAMNQAENPALAGYLGSGVTANRPTTRLTTAHVGAYWFDTTLGYPVWWTGAAWHNGAGAVV